MALAVKTSLIPATAQTPLDVRTVVATLADIPNIENPYVGLEVFVAETAKKYRITTLTTQTVGTQTVYAVGEYAALPDMTDLEGITEEDGAPISENYVIVTTLTDDGYIAVPNNNVPVKVELNGAIYDIDDCPMVNDGTNFKLLADYFLARANLTSYSGEYKVWLAGGKEGEKGEPGQDGSDGGTFLIEVVSSLPSAPNEYTLYLITE